MRFRTRVLVRSIDFHMAIHAIAGHSPDRSAVSGMYSDSHYPQHFRSKACREFLSGYLSMLAALNSSRNTEKKEAGFGFSLGT